MKSIRTISLALLPLGLMIAPPLSAQVEQAQATPKLTLEQKTALRCSAAFAIIADAQARGNETAREFPSVGDRGKEFFVRMAAQMMDELGVSRDVVAGLVAKEAQALWDEDKVEAVMPGCLLLLNASGV